MPKHRSKLISFRLTEQEYERLARVRAASGLKTVSDLAREATRQMVERRDAAGIGVEIEVRKLHNLIGELESRMKKLASLVEQSGTAEELQ